MKLLKILGNILYIGVITILLLVVVGTTFSAIETQEGLRVFVVRSGSMEPELRVGSIVLTAPQNEYHENDIVTFLLSPTARLGDPGAVITHRILSIIQDEEGVSYITKGDSNQAEDNKPIMHEQVVGKVVFKIPYAGYVVSFARTRRGFVLLIVIPAVLIAYNEITNIKSGISEIKEKKKATQSKSNAKDKKE